MSRKLLGAACLAVAVAGFAPRGALATGTQAQAVRRSVDADLASVRQILQTPEADIDLAKAKLMIDHMIDPSVDVDGTRAQLDEMANGLRSFLPTGASRRLTMDALRDHMYKANPWNGNRPFVYDLDDPFGANRPLKYQSTLPVASASMATLIDEG